jgi:predicted choloylglycine hydrolase
MSIVNVKEVPFSHVVLEGTSYEIGRIQGELIKKNPGYLSFLTSPPTEIPQPNPDQLEAALEFFAKYCPGLNDEIRGFADVVGVAPTQVIYYAYSHFSTGHCSHMVVLPGASSDGHVLVGRSYEWGFDDDFRLCTTRVPGFAAHLGCSIFLFGRLDGVNEHGLSVTMSAGAPGEMPQEDGCRFWAVIRTVLDRCRNVDEALELIAGIPISFNFNLILADRKNQAAIVEISCAHRSVRRIGPETPEQFVWATNHYTQPETLPYDIGRRWNSAVRHRTIGSRLRAATPNIDQETIRGILTDPVPKGVCCHYYEDGMGTLWSFIFDLTDGVYEIALGSPRVNPWRRFTLNDPAGCIEYTAKYPQESPEDPEAFYRLLKPGTEE